MAVRNCAACNLPLLLTFNYRKHLAQDLSPYTCFTNGCPKPNVYYITEAELERHVRNDHAAWQCPFCDAGPIYYIMQEILDHLLREHKDVASRDLPGLISLSSSHGMGIEVCPLCHESGPRDSPELVKHVMEHMHEFSLLSLPWSKEGSEICVSTVPFDLSSPVFSSNPRLSRHSEIKERFDLYLHRNNRFEKLKDRLERWFDEPEPQPEDQVVRGLLREYKSRPASTEKEDAKNHPSFFTGRLYFSESIASVSVGTSTLSERNAVKKDPNLQNDPVPGEELDVAGIALQHVAWTVPLDRNPHFIGREPQLAQLEGMLFAKNHTANVAIIGLGGIGKTQLVLELLFQIADKYPDYSIIWIPANNKESLYQAYLDAAQQLDIHGWEDNNTDVKKLMQEYLSKESTGRWLLVFDKADDIDMWMAKDGAGLQAEQRSRPLIDDLPKSKQGTILFLTCDRSLAVKLAQQNVVEVPAMEEDIAAQLLKNYLVNKELVSNRQDTHALLAQLNYLPLAIVQAAQYINEKSVTLADYLLLLARHEGGIADLQSQEFNDNGTFRITNSPMPDSRTELSQTPFKRISTPGRSRRAKRERDLGDQIILAMREIGLGQPKSYLSEEDLSILVTAQRIENALENPSLDLITFAVENPKVLAITLLVHVGKHSRNQAMEAFRFHNFTDSCLPIERMTFKEICSVQFGYGDSDDSEDSENKSDVRESSASAIEVRPRCKHISAGNAFHGSPWTRVGAEAFFDRQWSFLVPKILNHVEYHFSDHIILPFEKRMLGTQSGHFGDVHLAMMLANYQTAISTVSILQSR
jgi:hypothetical protein